MRYALILPVLILLGCEIMVSAMDFERGTSPPMVSASKVATFSYSESDWIITGNYAFVEIAVPDLTAQFIESGGLTAAWSSAEGGGSGEPGGKQWHSAPHHRVIYGQWNVIQYTYREGVFELRQIGESAKAMDFGPGHIKLVLLQ